MKTESFPLPKLQNSKFFAYPRLTYLELALWGFEQFRPGAPLLGLLNLLHYTGSEKATCCLSVSVLTEAVSGITRLVPCFV